MDFDWGNALKIVLSRPPELSSMDDEGCHVWSFFWRGKTPAYKAYQKVKRTIKDGDAIEVRLVQQTALGEVLVNDFEPRRRGA